MARYFLGIDGGQSGTTAVIGDETGRVIGEGSGGPCTDLSSLAAALHTACVTAGLDPQGIRFDAACLGLSGGSAGKEDAIRQLIRADRLLLTDDARIALSGALASEPGIVVIAGTGSIAYGANSERRTARAGGWGPLFGDEGGGFWIVRQAMRAALRFEEGWGLATSLRARLLDATGSHNINHLMHRCYTPEFPRSRVAALSILVQHAAEAGDPAALKILDDAARELALLAVAVRGQLFRSSEPVAIAYSGGVFQSRIPLANFRRWIEAEKAVRLVPIRYRPVVGALLEAYRWANVVPKL